MGDTASEYGRRRLEGERVLRLRDEDGQRRLGPVAAECAGRRRRPEVFGDEVERVSPLRRFHTLR